MASQDPRPAGSANTALAKLRETRGLLRSLAIYRGNPLRNRARRRFYKEFVRAGDLCFDIGAHAGNHVAALRGLGARVVAVEPQPRFARLLQSLYGDDPEVSLVGAAVGAATGLATLHISRTTPTVTTLSPDWIAEVETAPGFHNVSWDAAATVSVTTLDSLIERFGCPDFCKIDVEGHEADVLTGLSRPILSLSFEYVSATPGRTKTCLERLCALGDYAFNLSVDERLKWAFASWTTAEALLDWLAHPENGGRSGDVYCRLKSEPRA